MLCKDRTSNRDFITDLGAPPRAPPPPEDGDAALAPPPPDDGEASLAPPLRPDVVDFTPKRARAISEERHLPPDEGESSVAALPCDEGETISAGAGDSDTPPVPLRA